MKSFVKNQYSKLVFDRSLLIKQEEPCDIFIVVFQDIIKMRILFKSLQQKFKKKQSIQI